MRSRDPSQLKKKLLIKVGARALFLVSQIFLALQGKVWSKESPVLGDWVLVNKLFIYSSNSSWIFETSPPNGPFPSNSFFFRSKTI